MRKILANNPCVCRIHLMDQCRESTEVTLSLVPNWILFPAATGFALRRRMFASDILLMNIPQ